jgi:hypothetical protein
MKKFTSVLAVTILLVIAAVGTVYRTLGVFGAGANGSLEGMWLGSVNNTAVGWIFAGSQYQLWENAVMKESGTFSVSGNNIVTAAQNGRTEKMTHMFGPDGNSLVITDENGIAVTFQRSGQENIPIPSTPIPPLPPQPALPPPVSPQLPPVQQNGVTRYTNVSAVLPQGWTGAEDEGRQVIFMPPDNGVNVLARVYDYGAEIGPTARVAIVDYKTRMNGSDIVTTPDGWLETTGTSDGVTSRVRMTNQGSLELTVAVMGDVNRADASALIASLSFYK